MACVNRWGRIGEMLIEEGNYTHLFIILNFSYRIKLRRFRIRNRI